jgi:LPS-assembly protein
MKSNFFLILFILFFNESYAESLLITAKNISLDKNKNISVFENEVVVKTKDKTLKSDYAKYDRSNGLLILKENISVHDEKNNKMFADYAEYNEKSEILKTIGDTKVETVENYILNGKDLKVDGKNKIIISEKKSILRDEEGNLITLDNFEYLTNNSLFKSIGLIEIIDNKKNKYLFSQVYIDTKKKEILGTDSKSYFNSNEFKIHPKNKPRIFSNSINIKKEKSSFEKAVFTLCNYRNNDKCPPWEIRSKKMLHDNVKKTIYYDSATIKFYNIPIFYFPKLSHPDPTVDRRSGFLTPSMYDTKNLGSGFSIPYFFDLGLDKNFTLTNRLYVSENPLFLGEFHQAFRNSNLLTDFGYTEGYKKTSSKKRGGEKSHFFAKFIKNFSNEENYENSFELNFQEVSNDKYLKLYKIESNLVDYNSETLENSIKFSQERDNLFLGFNASIYETLKSDYSDKYEYILPELTIDTNLFSNENIGNLDLQTNYKSHNYDTNKLTNFLVSDLNYYSNTNTFNNVINSKILANLKNINYESKNVNIYKNDPTSELFGSIGLLSEVNLQKTVNKFRHKLKPKVLLRFAPGSMRKEDTGSRLTPATAFSMNRLSNINNYETGLSSTVGFDYKIKNKDTTKFDFSVSQIINEKENKKMADKTSLNEKLSDLVGSSSYNLSENFKLNYDFSIDQNYNSLNYSELGAKYNYGALNINFDYLYETKHIGDQDYFKTELSFKDNEKGLLSFKTKRSLKTNSSEFYNLSYEYINDCLRAGLVYRREFYRDSELEPEDSLMFKITLVPFGSIDSPKLN